MAEFELWAHGTSAHVEIPNRAIAIVRVGSGLRIEQELDSLNWIHLAIPTLRKQENSRLALTAIKPKYRTLHSNTAEKEGRDYRPIVHQIHVYDNDGRIDAGELDDGVVKVPTYKMEGAVGVSIQLLWGVVGENKFDTIFELNGVGAEFTEV